MGREEDKGKGAGLPSVQQPILGKVPNDEWAGFESVLVVTSTRVVACRLACGCRLQKPWAFEGRDLLLF